MHRATAFAVITLTALLQCSTCQAARTVAADVMASGQFGDASGYTPDISSDGRFVAFESDASNLVANDTNAKTDVFVRDTLLNTTTRVSVSSGGQQADDYSGYAAISPDGRFVAFSSYATNLVPDDTNGSSDAFLHDRQTGETVRVSLGPAGAQADGESIGASVSADGRYVTFSSYATNIAVGDTGDDRDLFRHDRVTHETLLLSQDPSGTPDGVWFTEFSMSADGRYVAFSSVGHVYGSPRQGWQVYVRDCDTGANQWVTQPLPGQTRWGGDEPEISTDGQHVVFASDDISLPGDINTRNKIYLWDRITQSVSRVSLGPAGAEPNGDCYEPSVNADGSVVSYESYATNLVGGDTNDECDVFCYDVATGQTARVSLATDESQPDNWSGESAVSGDGRMVVFDGPGSLLAGSGNTDIHIFVRDRFWQAPPAAATLFEAKCAPDGAAAVVSGLAVTAVFGEVFYVETSDRAIGMRVRLTGVAPAPGDGVTVEGVVDTEDSGEKCIVASKVAVTGLDAVLPLAMKNSALGGGDLSFSAGTGAGQQGVCGGSGLNNIGLLVRTCGRITARDTGWIEVSDGSGESLKCVLPAGVTVAPDVEDVIATGISSCHRTGGEINRLLLVRSGADVSGI